MRSTSCKFTLKVDHVTCPVTVICDRIHVWNLHLWKGEDLYALSYVQKGENNKTAISYVPLFHVQCSGKLLTVLWDTLSYHDTMGEAGRGMVSSSLLPAATLQTPSCFILSTGETAVPTLDDDSPTLYGNAGALDDEWGTHWQTQRVLPAEVYWSIL